MVKCKITGKKIEETFLGKIIGTYIKDENGKKIPISREVQKKYRTKEEILKNL